MSLIAGNRRKDCAGFSGAEISFQDPGIIKMAQRGVECLARTGGIMKK